MSAGTPLEAIYRIGSRIEMAPHSDAWMQGDRYAEVVKVGRKLLHARFDRSGRYGKVHPSQVARVIP